MLSMAVIGSGAGAANYYAGDNYYTDGQLTEASVWAGQGAEMLGLSGKVDANVFEAVLAGNLPNGEVVPAGTRGEHRPGLDMTFSAPKSVSLLAYIGGDDRLLSAHIDSVKASLSWAEKTFAEARVSKGRGQEVVGTGNLLVALFQHDTSRLLDPQAHIHAVIANATKAPDGKWRALAEYALWQGKTTIASVYNAEFRQRVEALGYRTEPTGKHGQFEIAGIDRKVIMAFSQRRAEIEQEATKLEHNTPAAMTAATLRTRGDKPENVDRVSLHAEWQERAKGLGFNALAMVAEAAMRAAREATPWRRLVEGVKGIAEQGRVLVERLGLVEPTAPADPLVPEKPGRLSPDQFAAAHAVASAVRHRSEREAGFSKVDLVKAALDLGAPVGVAAIDARIGTLVGKGLLIAGSNDRMMTTAEALAQEKAYLAAVRDGKGQTAPLLARDDIGEVLKAEARAAGIRMTAGQSRAATQILESRNRVVHIQGNAGTGKSAMLAPVARMVEEEGRTVIGLAVSNAITNRLKADVKIPAMTVARFVREHGALLSDAASREQRDASIASLKGALIVVDEASMLSTRDAAKLVAIANAAEVGRLALVGDTKQLGAVEAGKPFALGQDAATVIMDENLRAKSPEMLALHKAAQSHDVAQLVRLVEPNAVEAPGAAAATAAKMWVDLPKAEQDRTSIFVSGRQLRNDVNREVQALRHQRGELGEALHIKDTLVPVHLTREEQKHPQSYRVGQVIELSRPLTSQALPAGQIKVMAKRPGGEIIVQLPGGKGALFRPARLAGNRVEDAVRVFDAQDLTLRVGDPIRWTANDHNRGLANAETARFKGFDRNGLLFQTAEGNNVALTHEDPMLKRIDLAYAANAHASQGATADMAIVVAQSTEGALIDRSLVGALFTRTREQMTFVVDNLSSFERRARENAGEKASALEIAGQATDRNAANTVGAKQSSDPKPAGRRLPIGMWESTPEPDRPKIICPEREPAPEQYNFPLPERQRDWGL
jgi:conjugative relaxase-like TrwC/TraI family protein